MESCAHALVHASVFSLQDIPSLRVVSYIGCGISIVCLIVTIGAILLFRYILRM